MDNKTKLQQRAHLCRCLGRPDDYHYIVLNLDRNIVHKCRAQNFKMYNCSQDPTLSANMAQTQRKTKTAPKTLKEAQSRPDSYKWKQSWNSELDKLEQRGTVTWVPISTLPPAAKILPVKINMTIKRDADNNVIEHKTRCNLRGDLQKPYEHYDPQRI